MTDANYVNLSITKLTFTGYDSLDIKTTSDSFIDCVQGGIIFASGITGMANLCKNYTSKENMANSQDKVMMNIISDKSVLMFVVYSYKFYSEVSLEATVSATVCKGVHYPKQHDKGKSEIVSSPLSASDHKKRNLMNDELKISSMSS